MGVASLERGPVGPVGVEGVAARSAVVVGGGEVDVAGTQQRQAWLWEDAGSSQLQRKRSAPIRTGTMRVIPSAVDELRRREPMGMGVALGGVRRFDGRTGDGIALLSKGLCTEILWL